jgi:hypothetical protein
MRQRQRTHRTPVILRSEAAYGPDGLRLLSAAILLTVTGCLIGLVGAALVMASLDQGHTAWAGNALLVLAILMAMVGGCRAVQGAVVGRRYRSG